jgi:DNA-binding NarL/FixJ family response regulator
MAPGHYNFGRGRTNSRVEDLTERETQVLTHIARGLSVKEIATVLNVSAKTVEGHKASIMAKLNIRDRVLLARYATREGLVSVRSGDDAG